MANLLNSSPTRQDFIPYELAEAALFEALRPQLRLLALDYAHHFGADVADRVADFAEAIFPKAEQILAEHGHRRVFGDAHLWAKCQKWAAWWCEKIERQHRPRPHTRFSAEAAALGRERAHAAIQRRTDQDASLAQCWRATGKAVDWIAQKLNCGRSTVYRLFKRKCGQWKNALVSFGKDSLPVPSLFDTSEVEKAIPNETSAEIEALGARIPELLRAHWNQQKGNSPHAVQQSEVSPAYTGVAN